MGGHRAVLRLAGENNGIAGRGGGNTVGPPQSPEGEIFRRHGFRECPVPAHEGKAGPGGCGRRRDSRAVVQRQGLESAAAVGVKGDGVAVAPPQGLQDDLRVPGIGPAQGIIGLAGGPAALRIAGAGKDRPGEGEGHVVHLGLLLPHGVFRVLIGIIDHQVGFGLPPGHQGQVPGDRVGEVIGLRILRAPVPAQEGMALLPGVGGSGRGFASEDRLGIHPAAAVGVEPHRPIQAAVHRAAVVHHLAPEVPAGDAAALVIGDGAGKGAVGDDAVVGHLPGKRSAGEGPVVDDLAPEIPGFDGASGLDGDRTGKGRLAGAPDGTRIAHAIPQHHIAAHRATVGAEHPPAGEQSFLRTRKVHSAPVGRTALFNARGPLQGDLLENVGVHAAATGFDGLRGVFRRAALDRSAALHGEVGPVGHIDAPAQGFAAAPAAGRPGKDHLAVFDDGLTGHGQMTAAVDIDSAAIAAHPRAFHNAAADGGPVRHLHRSPNSHAAAVAAGPAAPDDRAAAHLQDRPLRVGIDSAAAIGGNAAEDAAAVHIERALCAVQVRLNEHAAAVCGRAAHDAAALHVQHRAGLEIHAAAVVVDVPPDQDLASRPAGDDAAADGLRAVFLVQDPETVVVGRELVHRFGPAVDDGHLLAPPHRQDAAAAAGSQPQHMAVEIQGNVPGKCEAAGEGDVRFHHDADRGFERRGSIKIVFHLGMDHRLLRKCPRGQQGQHQAQRQQKGPQSSFHRVIPPCLFPFRRFRRKKGLLYQKGAKNPETTHLSRKKSAKNSAERLFPCFPLLPLWED